MKRISLRLLAVALFSAATPAQALIVADSSDDICAPAADPCVVGERVQVVAPGNLDFGLRTVHVTGNGRFERTANISCGRFSADVGSGKVAADANNGGGDAGMFSVTARRACSGDNVTPCLDDTVCVGGGLGTCSSGNGTIDVDGQFLSAGGPGGRISFRAAGDIHTAGLLYVNSTTVGKEGGVVEIESFLGTVDSGAHIKGNSGAPGEYGEPEQAGTVTIDAAVDVRIGAPIELNGGQYAGSLSIHAGRDVSIEDDVTSNGGGLFYATGGSVDVAAGRHISMAGDGSSATRMQLNGGSRIDQYYGAPYAGDGGFASFDAGGDIDVDALSIIESRTPIGSCDSNPYGGEIELIANGETRVDGDIFSAGKGNCGSGGEIRLEAGDRVVVGDTSELDTVARFGGDVYLKSSGTIDIGGKINVRGSPPGYAYYLYGQSGYAKIYGTADVSLSGSVLAGSGDGGSSSDIFFNVCRLTIEDTGRIDATFGAPNGGGSNFVRIGERMVAEAGSQMLSNPIIDGENTIRYRDPAKSPVLLGEITPDPILITDPSIPGCPVCGNGEIDKGESCDDGNTSSGDGCRADCQDEGCIAATPGYPGTTLCSDGDACTVDHCDPMAHACVNTASCEEGIACTLDACVSGACQHTPDDSACDDGNDCTIGTCSTASSCVYTNQPGEPCEDGDICTQTGTCNFGGNCSATDGSHTVNDKLKVRFGGGAGDDRLTLKTQMPLSQFTTSPSSTGLTLHIQDALDDAVIDAVIPAGKFEDQGGGRWRFRNDGSVASALGVSSVSVRTIAAKEIAKVSVKGGDMELADAEGESALTISLLWGTDPATDDCLTVRRLPCTTKGTSLGCAPAD